MSYFYAFGVCVEAFCHCQLYYVIGACSQLLFVAVTDDAIKKGLKAGDIVKEIAPIVGGGRPNMAQAGGKDPSKLDEALKKTTELVKQKHAL